MIKAHFGFIALALATAACTPPSSETTAPDTAATGVPAEFAALAIAAAPGLRITSGEFNAGGDQFEVTGMSPNGDELELDIVQMNGGWAVLEIQRDVPWSSVPAPVRTAAAAAPDAFEPVRVIESTQVEDGSLVFELFSASQSGTASRGPAMEVRWHEGRAEILP